MTTDSSTTPPINEAAAAQEAAQAAASRGIALESTGAPVPGEVPRILTTIARGPHDRPEEGVYEGDAMMVAAHKAPEVVDDASRTYNWPRSAEVVEFEVDAAPARGRARKSEPPTPTGE